MGGFGPAQPILRNEEHTSLTVAGLHETSLGVAAILAGFAGPTLAQLLQSLQCHHKNCHLALR